MTAVEWLVEQIRNNKFVKASEQIEAIKQAKEMDKEQQQKIGIIMAIFAEEVGDKKCIELLNKAEQYYNETFKSE